MTGSIDTMFAQLTVTSDPWATTIAGFILVLIIVFGAIAVFGKSKQQIGGFGIMLISFIASVLATALGLFPTYVLLVFMTIMLVAILLKVLFFRGGN